MGFYEDIAADYDQMTRFQDRLERESAILTRWIARYDFHSALDIACGTGLHAILLAQQGIQTVGADLSAAMLKKAQRHAREAEVQIDWVQTAMEQARQHIRGRYEAIFCLGNSLPHLLTRARLEAAVANWFELLVPGGIVAIQILNYQRILNEQNRIVGIHRQGTTEYVRFYDFLPDQIRFNLLTIHWDTEPATQSLTSTLLYPYQSEELRSALLHRGFHELECYGDLGFQPFDPAASSNLVLVARKARTAG